MAMVTELDVFAAVRQRLTAVGGWFGDPAIEVHFGRRAPGSSKPPCVVIAVEQQDAEDDDIESDGLVAQRFAVEIVARCIGPEDAEAATALMAAMDAAWTAESGLSLPGNQQTALAARPVNGRLRMLESLVGGEDQYTAVKRWIIETSAMIGA